MPIYFLYSMEENKREMYVQTNSVEKLAAVCAMEGCLAIPSEVKNIKSVEHIFPCLILDEEE